MYKLDKPARYRMSALIYRQLVLYWSQIDRKFDMFFWPCVDAVLFGAIATYAQNSGGSHSTALLLSGFVMAQVVWQTHINFVRFFMQEGWDWNVLYVLTRPARASEVLLAFMGLATVVTVTAELFITLMIMIVFHLHLLVIPPEIVLLMPILMMMGWSTAMLATSLILRLGPKADNLVWGIFGLIGPLSGSIVPAENLPKFLRPFSRLLPMTHAYNAGRAILFGGKPVAFELGLSAVLAVTTFSGSLWFMSTSFRKFRQRGFISRYT